MRECRMRRSPGMRVNVCIPHYIQEQADPACNPNGYGSLRKGATLKRSLAMGRCISSLLNLQRSARTALLNIATQQIDHWSNGGSPLEINITVVTDGHHRLDDLLQHFGARVQVIDVDLDDPRQLPLACRDHLINTGDGADLLAYLEDDVVIDDPGFFDKQLWFLEKTNHRFCLMPHRYERCDSGGLDRLLVDGPLAPSFIGQYAQPQTNAAKGAYAGTETVSFDITDNPHSGMFVVSGTQASILRQRDLPRSGFVGPLETAATLTVLQNFPVMKPSLSNWTFLRIEHGHPSFLHYLSKLPTMSMDASQP